MRVLSQSMIGICISACMCVALTEPPAASNEPKHKDRLLHSALVQRISGEPPTHLQLVEARDRRDGAHAIRVFEVRELTASEDGSSDEVFKTLYVIPDISTHDRFGGPVWERSGAILSTNGRRVIYIAIAKATQNAIIVRMFLVEMREDAPEPTPALRLPSNSHIAESEIHIPGEGGKLVVKGISGSDEKIDVHIGRDSSDGVVRQLRLDLERKRFIDHQQDTE